MKIRKGFVSNSSSSSYICDVCGHDKSGWDLSLSDAEMVECTCGHVVCEDELISPEKEEVRKDLIEYLENQIKYYKKYLSTSTEDSRKEFWENCIQENSDAIERLKTIDLNEHDFARVAIEDIDLSNLEEVLFKTNGRYGVLKAYCPICNYNVLTNIDAKKFLMQEYNLTDKEVLNRMKEKDFLGGKE